MARPKGSPPMGGPKIKTIDWDVFDGLCGIQCTQEEIADVLNVDINTLIAICKREHGASFSELFRQKRGKGKVSLRRAQWTTAIKGNPTMQIWLGKQYLAQKDKSDAEIKSQAASADSIKLMIEIAQSLKEELDK